ncbi:AraC family transcriptional regulator [Roseibium sp.]|uniref:AraC family transcriptional regulator n=1 Tax=Roseibium sp. TaxID=1936156 RepID=UPI003D0C27B0
MPTVPIPAQREAPASEREPHIGALADALKEFAPANGVTPSPIGSVWALRVSNCLPYHRGRNRGLSVTVAVTGRKIVTLGDRQILNDRGHVIAIHGDTAYQAAVQASPAEPYLALKLQLPLELIAQTLVRFAETGIQPPATGSSTVLSCEPLEKTLAAPLLRLLECFRDPADCHMLAPLHLQEISYRLLRSEAFGVLKSLVTGAETRLVGALRYIEAEAHRSDLTVSEIASEVAMSPSNFAHRFTTLFGQSPMQYRKHVRLDLARQQLLSTGWSVAAVAQAAGYASTSHFTRDFKTAFGLAPRRYAEAMRTAGFAAS